MEETKIVIEKFTARYGNIGEMLDEDTWIMWLGIYTIGYQDAIEKHHNAVRPITVGADKETRRGLDKHKT